MTRNLVFALGVGAALAVSFSGSVADAAPGPRVPPDKLGSFVVPRAPKRPTIDGRIDPDEWRNALAVSGLAQQNPGGNLLILRPTTYFLMWDEQNLYLACRTWIMPGLKPGAPGRTPNSATAFDPGIELGVRPMGKNVPQNTGDQAFKFFINTMGATGDMCRVAVGALLKNWLPDFPRAWRQTAQGTAPLGGSWWECEVVLPAKDFDLVGPNRAGDTWRLLLAFNHLPGWMQAAVPINSGYFDASGWPTFTLADDAPAVQVTMDDLPGVKDGVAAVRFAVTNPGQEPAAVDVLAQFTEWAGDKEQTLLEKKQTLTVEPGRTAELRINEKFPRDLGKSTGGLYYLATSRGRVLYRYYAYFQLGYPEAWTRYVAPKGEYPLSCDFNPVRNNLRLAADTFYLADPSQAEKLTYIVAPKGGGAPAAQGELTAVRHFYFETLLEIPGLAPGEYEVRTRMALKDGTTLGPQVGEFVKKDEAKEFAAWWKNKLGNTERVIPPFTAMKCDGNAVGLWGRRYALGALGLAEGIVSQERPVLAAPARIVVVRNGQEQAVRLNAGPRITEARDWRVSFAGEAEGAGLRFTATGTIEQDGLCLLHLTYAPAGKEPVKLDALRLEWPLADDDEQLVLCIGAGGNFSPVTARGIAAQAKGRLWSTLETGRGGSLMAVGSFYPEVWVGNERRGFLWAGDSDRGWVPDNEVPAHELVRTDKELLLRNHIVARPFELAAPRTITFGYSASPFKPLVQGWRLAIHSEDGTFSGPHRQRKDPKTGREIDGTQYVSPPELDPAKWSEVWAEFKPKADEKVRREQPFDPSQARNREYVHTSIALMGWGPLTFDSVVSGYFAPEWGDNTYGEVQRDYLIWLLNRQYREGGVRTNYWDIFYVAHFPTVQNGMAYELPDGRVQPGFNTLNLRQFMMRQRALQVDCGIEPGGMVTHSTNAYPLVAFPWIDAVLNGEWAELTDSSTRDWVDSFPPDYHKAMSTPQNFGVVISWMNLIHIKDPARTARVFRGFIDWVRFHDCSWYWQDGGRPPKPLLEWGLNDARLEYVPYWRNTAVTAADKDVRVACWRLSDRVFVMAFNTDANAPKDARLKVDFKALGLVPKQAWPGAYAIRELRGARLFWFDQSSPPDPTPTLDGDTVTVSALAPHTARYFGIRLQEQGAVERFTAAFKPIADRAGLNDNALGQLREAFLDWGLVTEQTEVLPFGKAEFVTPAQDKTEVALIRLPDRVVLAVANADGQARNLDLRVDLAALELKPERVWQEFIQVRAFDSDPKLPPPTLAFYEGKLTVPAVPANGVRFVALRRY